ncbi:MAG: EAL domain-containing protein [Lachnospiraceae bacterium]|nr:EAL domain-containing protein [Lachnospiraceae bacterium]
MKKLSAPAIAILTFSMALLILLSISYQNYTRDFSRQFNEKLSALISSGQITDDEINFFKEQSYVLHNMAKDFTYKVLLIVSLLIVCIMFFYTFCTRQMHAHHSSLLLEQQRFKIALSHTKDTVWEYTLKTNTLIKEDASVGIYIGNAVIPDFPATVIRSGSLHPDDYEAFYHFCTFLLSSEPSGHVEVRAKNADNEYIWYELSGTKLYDADHNPISVIGQSINIHDKKQELMRLQELMGQDSLTKLYNHGKMKECITELLNRAEKPAILAFLIIDIDNFKQINDTLGHLFGDAVLIDLSTKLKKLFQKHDIIGRIGGDEFAVLIYDAPSLSYIQSQARNACRLFHEIYIGDNASLCLSGSVGVSLYPSDGTTFDSLYRSADTALYAAKNQGRNQFCMYSEKLPALPDYEMENRIHYSHPEVKFFHEDKSLVDSNIIANIIEILFDSREIDISINMVLSLIGGYYNLDHISIMEFSEDGKTCMVSYEWYSDASYKLPYQAMSAPIEEVKPALLFEKGTNGIFYTSDVKGLLKNQKINSNVRASLRRVKSLFQCGIYDHGTYTGYVNISILKQVHKWQKNEIDSLSLLLKVIGGYLNHLRSTRKANLLSKKDLLTGTYNFNTFLTAVDNVLSNKDGRKRAVFYLDISQFKLLNENYGYQNGDLILTSLAQILMDVSPEPNLVCRITGDKFAALYEYTTTEDLSSIAELILEKGRQIRSLEGEYFKFFLSIGICFTADYDQAIVCVDRANIARKNTKTPHKSSYTFFTDAMRHVLLEQKLMEDLMEDALKNKEFLVYYQPKVNIQTMELIGAEALTRWIRNDGQIVSPASFIPFFEENGFITELDYYVLDSVCQYIRQALDRNQKIYPISVNFSRAHFKTDVFPEKLREIVSGYEIPFHLIEIEITESAFVEGKHYLTSVLQKIKSYGFSLSMDDFGSGLSSLNLLSDLPFDVLKIDKDFFHSKTATKREKIVISSIVEMASKLHMDVICEGVETREQSDFLKSIGCYMAQGYLYDKPLPLSEFESRYLPLTDVV